VIDYIDAIFYTVVGVLVLGMGVVMIYAAWKEWHR